MNWWLETTAWAFSFETPFSNDIIVQWHLIGDHRMNETNNKNSAAFVHIEIISFPFPFPFPCDSSLAAVHEPSIYPTILFLFLVTWPNIEIIVHEHFYHKKRAHQMNLSYLSQRYIIIFSRFGLPQKRWLYLYVFYCIQVWWHLEGNDLALASYRIRCWHCVSICFVCCCSIWSLGWIQLIRVGIVNIICCDVWKSGPNA